MLEPENVLEFDGQFGEQGGRNLLTGRFQLVFKQFSQLILGFRQHVLLNKFLLGHDNPVFPHAILFVEVEFLAKVFLHRRGRSHLHDPIRRAQAAPAVEFSPVADDADVGLDDRVNPVARRRVVGIWQAHVEGRFHHPAGFSLEKRINFAVNRA